MDSAALPWVPEPGILGQTAALAFSPGSINAASRPNYAVDVDRPRARSLMALKGPRSSEDFTLVWPNQSHARCPSPHPVTFPFVLGNLVSRQVSSGCGSEVTYRVDWQRSQQ